MLYLVEAHPTIEVGDRTDSDEGPGPYIAKIIERFQPQAIYGNATRRQTFMVVELETPAKMAELMYVLAWWLKTEPVFTPIMAPETYAEAIANAKKIFRPLTSRYFQRRSPRHGDGAIGFVPMFRLRGRKEVPMEKSIQDICLGIFILLLSLVIWRLTHNALGWVVLFLPGGNGSFTSNSCHSRTPLGRAGIRPMRSAPRLHALPPARTSRPGKIRHVAPTLRPITNGRLQRTQCGTVANTKIIADDHARHRPTGTVRVGAFAPCRRRWASVTLAASHR